jgi:hypothetical protein
MGINLSGDPIEIESGWSAQCFAKGQFAGYSIRNLAEYYCKKIGKRLRIYREDDHGN